jgi:hypothetical protein
VTIDWAEYRTIFDPGDFNQASNATTGHHFDRPSGMPIFRPTPFWSVLERRRVMISPCRTRSTSMQLIARSSDRPAGKPDQEESTVAHVLQRPARGRECGEKVVA